MKKHICWGMAIAACALPLLTGCSEKMEEEMTAPVAGTTLLSATLESQSATRSAFGDGGEFSWLKGDKVMAQVQTGIAPFVLKEGAGTNEAVFEAQGGSTLLPGGYAVSPADIYEKIEGGALYVTLPDSYTQEYVSAEDLTRIPTHAPMVGTIANGSVGFRNLTAMVRLCLTNITKAGCRIVVTAKDSGAGGRLSGTFKVRQGGDGKQFLSAADEEGTGNSVTIIYKGTKQPTDSEKQYFYIPLPVVALEASHYDIDVYNKWNPGDGEKPVLKGTTLTIERPVERNILYVIGERPLPPAANVAPNSAEANRMITEFASQQFDEEITLESFDGDLELPSNIPDDSHLTIRIKSMADAELAVKESANTRAGIGGSGRYGLTLIFLDGTVENKLTVNTPKAQLTLDGTKVTLSNLDIASVTNATVKSGVTVTEMSVTKVADNTNEAPGVIVEGTVQQLNYTPSSEDDGNLVTKEEGQGKVEKDNGKVTIISNYNGEGSQPIGGEWE